MKKIKKVSHNKIVKIICLLVLPIIIELFMFGKIHIDKAFCIRIIFVYGIYSLIIIYKILEKYSNCLKKMLDYIIKKRYIIALITLIIMIMGKINFSSIDQWRVFLGETQQKSNLIGVSRAIRSDEWLVQTPMMLTQSMSKSGYNIHNENIGQGSTNLLMTSAAVRDIVAVSRPLTWGFLILGAEYGYSFYWCLKMIALIMVSLELTLKISKKDKLLGLTGGLLLGLAPVMMWWASTSVTDGYIFGTAVIVLFGYYMENLDWKVWKKILIAIGIIICLPAFAFTIYPAYQVPFAFLMAIFMINDYVKHMRELKKIDYIIMGVTICICLSLIARFVILSWDGIKTMMNTVYPGKRFETGGTFTVPQFISSFINIYLPYTGANINSSELSTYIYPFIGLITLMVIYINDILKEKNKNENLTISLIVLFLVYIVWEFIGFPSFLAKISLLYFSPEKRTNLVLGLLGTILTIILLKKISGQKNIITKGQAITIGVITVIVSYALINQLSYKEFFTPFKKEILIVLIFSMTYLLLIGNKKAWCYTMCGIAIVAGIYVNPIVSGTDLYTKSEVAKKIQEIEQKDEDAIWLGRTNFNGQYLMVNGAECINGVNIYPNFKWLKIVDPDEKYNEIYNRYAHINTVLSDYTEFKLLGTDIYEVHLTYQDLKKLNVKYYYTMEKFSDKEKEKFHLKVKYENNEKAQYIYEIN